MTGRIYSELPKKTLEINSCSCAFCQHTIQTPAKPSSFLSIMGWWPLGSCQGRTKDLPMSLRHLVVIPHHCTGVCWWQQRSPAAAGRPSTADKKPALAGFEISSVLAQLLELLLLSLHKTWPRSSRSPVKRLLLNELRVHWAIKNIPF